MHTTRGRSQRTLRASEQRIPFERWFDLVFKFRLSTGDDGFLHAWMDGKRIAEHEGPLGYPSPGFKDYLKIGYYNWSRFDSPRTSFAIASADARSSTTGSFLALASNRATSAAFDFHFVAQPTTGVVGVRTG